MSSATLSDATTLTPTSPASTLEQDYNRDYPVCIDEFIRHVRASKVLLGIALAGALSVEIGLVLDGVRLPLDEVGRLAALGDYWITVSGVSILVRTPPSSSEDAKGTVDIGNPLPLLARLPGKTDQR
jgi:hypothetical protein